MWSAVTSGVSASEPKNLSSAGVLPVNLRLTDSAPVSASGDIVFIAVIKVKDLDDPNVEALIKSTLDLNAANPFLGSNRELSGTLQLTPAARGPLDELRIDATVKRRHA